jgi:hypothetical protein
MTKSQHEPLPDVLARHRHGFGGGFLALVIAPDGSGLSCRPVSGETTDCERLSRDEMIEAIVELYGGLASFRRN